MTDQTTFTERDKEGSYAVSLGPEYFASNRLAQAMIEKFNAEHLKPLVEKVADEFRDKLWSDVTDWLLSDTEQNVAGAIRYMVEQTVTALLSGEEWAMQRYPYADYDKGKKIRKAVAEHGGQKLMLARIADLEAELRQMKETLEWLRR